MQFRDRREAGELLARTVASRLFYPHKATVVGLPRGGVVVAAAVARHVHVPLRVALVRKVGAPGNPELAVCAVGDGGVVVCDDELVQRFSEHWLEGAISIAQQDLILRRERYARWVFPSGAPVDEVVVVDDGAATGLTTLAAIEVVRSHGAQRVVVALPVAPLAVAHMLRGRADEVVVYHEAAEFAGAVGAYYEHFPQIEDEEVEAILEGHPLT